MKYPIKVSIVPYGFNIPDPDQRKRLMSVLLSDFIENEEVCSNPVIVEGERGLHVIPITVYNNKQYQAALNFIHEILTHSDKEHYEIRVSHRETYMNNQDWIEIQHYEHEHFPAPPNSRTNMETHPSNIE